MGSQREASSDESRDSQWGHVCSSPPWSGSCKEPCRHWDPGVHKEFLRLVQADDDFGQSKQVNTSTNIPYVDTVFVCGGHLNLPYVTLEEVQGLKKMHILDRKLKQSLIKIACFEIWTRVEFPAPQPFQLARAEALLQSHSLMGYFCAHPRFLDL